MMGYMEWSDAPCRRSVCNGRKEVCGVNFCAVSIFQGERTPEFLLRRRLKKAAELLRRRGICQAVFPESFSYGDVFAKCGVFPIDVLPLCRALAPELAWSAAEARGIGAARARIAVCGDRLTAELAWTVTRLCMRSRYLLLAAPDRDGAFCRRVRREYGAALVQTVDAGQIAAADVCLLFSPREAWQGGNTVLRLYHGADLPPVCLRLLERPERIPPACDRMQMLAALYAADAIRREQISGEILSNVPLGDPTA